MNFGPQPMTHKARLALAYEIANQIHAHYGDTVLAIGLYGSLARGTDGPYSDIEMWCVLRGEEPMRLNLTGVGR
jgi:kanamycin nucleotidyltransferase